MSTMITPPPPPLIFINLSIYIQVYDKSRKCFIFYYYCYYYVKVSSPGLAAPDAAGAGGAAATASLMRQRLDAVVEDGGRPQSAGGRLMSISSLLEGISRSPMSSQVRTAVCRHPSIHPCCITCLYVDESS